MLFMIGLDTLFPCPDISMIFVDRSKVQAVYK